MKAETIGMNGNLTIRVFEEGRLVSSQVVHNLVVLSGRNLLRDVLGGTVGTTAAAIMHIAVGTSGTAPAVGNTALGAEVYRQVITGTSTTDGSLNVQGYLGSSEANGNTLAEAGLFATNGTMVARALFDTPIEKTTTQTVSLSWDLNIMAGT